MTKPLLWATLLAVGMLVGTQLDDELPAQLVQKRTSTGLDRLENAIGYVEARYGESIDLNGVTEAMIPKLMDELDPHSYYLDPSHYEQFNERFAGKYKGVGLEYRLLDDTVYVLKALPGSPAAVAQLGLGDQILQVDDVSVSGSKMDDEKLRALWQTDLDSVTLLIKPSQATQSTAVVLERTTVDNSSISLAHMLDEENGYIKIDRFGAQTYADFMRHIERLVPQSLTNLIIDVRGNPGGSLDQTIKIVDQFVTKKGELLAWIEGAHLPKAEFRSTANVFFKIEQICVLVDEHSVSASEVLAGILQDLDRAIIIGRKTYGKALVQETFELDDRSAINLTVGRYYLPSGRHLQRDYSNLEAYKTHPESDTTSWSWVVTKDGRKLPVGQGVIPDVEVQESSRDSLDEGLLNQLFDSLLRKRNRPHSRDALDQFLAQLFEKEGLSEMQITMLRREASLWMVRHELSDDNIKLLAGVDPMVATALQVFAAKPTPAEK